MSQAIQPHPDPALAALGVEIVAGGAGPKRAGPGARGGRPPLTDIMSPLRTHRAWFHEISVGASESIDATHSAWYLLRSIDAGAGGAFLFHGADIDMRPTDPAGAATTPSGTALPWGEINGISACIVIDMNLNLIPGAWNSRRGDLPAIENAQSFGQITPATLRDYMIVESFPAGRITDAVPSRTFSARRYLPAAVRITDRDTLDVALVLRGSYVTAPEATRILVGYAKIELYTSPVDVEREWI